jgi:hypothetical protein
MGRKVKKELDQEVMLGILGYRSVMGNVKSSKLTVTVMFGSLK